MKKAASTREIKRLLAPPRRSGRSVGFVPTMGFLHEGHLSLVRRAKRENDLVVASIFVNPLQFGPKEDYKRYPRDLARDSKMLAGAGADYLFSPSVKDFYPPGFQTAVTVSELARPLCGISRPAHFQGVCTVVAKLLNVVAPDVLYLGQKDYQQYRVLERMVRDLDLPLEVRPCPIVREKDGLAMSSRNVYLSPEHRNAAPGIHRALAACRAAVRKGERDARRLQKELQRALAALPGARVDYAEIVDAATLESVIKLKARPALAAAAVFFGPTRLIDNVLL